MDAEGGHGPCSSSERVCQMSASPSLMVPDDLSPISPSGPSSPRSPASLSPAERRELLQLREEVAQLRLRLAKPHGRDPREASPSDKDVPSQPSLVEADTAPGSSVSRLGDNENASLFDHHPDKDSRCGSDSLSESPQSPQRVASIGEVRQRSDWALRERAYRCARDLFMGSDGSSGPGRVARGQLLAALRQEPEVASYFESPRQHFRRLLVEGDPGDVLDWEDFVNCYVQQCKQSISSVKADVEREGSPATASTRSPMVPLQRCSEIGRASASPFDCSPSPVPDSLLVSPSSADELRGEGKRGIQERQSSTPRLMLWSTGLAHRSAERWAEAHVSESPVPDTGSVQVQRCGEAAAASEIVSPSSETYCSSSSPPPRRPRLAWSSQPASVATAPPCSSRTCSARSARSSPESSHTATPQHAASPWGENSYLSSTSTSREVEDSFAAARSGIAESFAKAQAEPLRAPRLNWKLPASAGPLPPVEATAMSPALSPRHPPALRPQSRHQDLAGPFGMREPSETPASPRTRTPRGARAEHLPKAVSILFPQPQPVLSQSAHPGHPGPASPILGQRVVPSSASQPARMHPFSPAIPARPVAGESQQVALGQLAQSQPGGHMMFMAPGQPRSVSPCMVGAGCAAGLQRSQTPPPAATPAPFVYAKAWHVWPTHTMANCNTPWRGQ